MLPDLRRHGDLLPDPGLGLAAVVAGPGEVQPRVPRPRPAAALRTRLQHLHLHLRLRVGVRDRAGGGHPRPGRVQAVRGGPRPAAAGLRRVRVWRRARGVRVHQVGILAEQC